MGNKDKPYIICHMMSSIDGRITTGKGRRTEEWKQLLKGYDEYSCLEESFKADAWMCGRVTMEQYASGKSTPLPKMKEIKIPKGSYIALPKHKGAYAIVVDTKGRLRWKSNLLFGTDHLIVIVTEKTPKKYLAYLRENKISYIIAGRQKVDFARVFKVLKNEFGITKLLVEGGGKLNGSVLRSGLIDEISLLVAPLVVGAIDAPSVFDTEPLSLKELPKRLKLFSIQRLKDEIIWLRYKTGA